jgi:uncharacterized protein YebE (UPF0316 family)
MLQAFHCPAEPVATAAAYSKRKCRKYTFAAQWPAQPPISYILQVFVRVKTLFLRMNFFEGIDPSIVEWVIIPLMIFLARIVDVTLGTLRIVFISKGDKMIAPLLGFIEVLIWLVAITQVMQNLSNFVSYLAWAGGFATGNFLGLRIEQKLALGQVVVRIITVEQATKLIDRFRGRGYRLTCVDARGSKGKVNLLFMIVKRKKLDEVIGIIRDYNPNAFYSIEDVRSVSEIEVTQETPAQKNRLSKLFPLRKSK